MNQNNLLSVASFSPRSLQFPNAWIGHLPFAAWVIQATGPKTFVELGTHSGNSYFSFCQSVLEAGFSTKCYAVDTWQGDEHAGEYDDEIFAKVNAHNQEHYAEFSHLLRMNFNDAATNFPDASIDLLHIDGLHTYEAVRHDFETWLPKLADGAVVLFHDTNVHERDFGVWRLWKELQTRYPNNLEFVHSHGLGVLQLNNAPDEKKLDWLQPNSPEKQALVSYFAALGSRQTERYELRELQQHASNLNLIIAARDSQISNLSGQIANLSGQIVNLNGHTENLNGQIAAVYNSTSWRVTAPLRTIAHQAKRARRVIELAKPAIQRGGGLSGALRKAKGLYDREGWSGIRRGFRVIAESTQVKPALASGGFDRNDYPEWVRRYDTITDDARGAMRNRVDAFGYKPVISVLMPTYNPKPEWLREAIESVRQQIYPHWELCIADDASTDQAIRPILEAYAASDPRIKIVFREQNGHISAASNSALEVATGEWLALLDHDDLLAEHALFWVADAINHRPDARLIYSDEDKIDQKGKRFGPYFKCDWNVELFYAQNMFSHLGVYQRTLVRDAGGFRIGFEGSQDYDLALRCAEKISTEEILHIPRVLYHWRVHADSTSLSTSTKPYAALAGVKALKEHFQRQNIHADVELTPLDMRRVRHVLPTILPLVSLIIPTRNGLHLIRQCITSILEKTTYKNYEIIIVDNGSDDPSVIEYFKSLQSQAAIRIIRDDRDFNYSALNNAAIQQARGDIVGLVNNDIEVISPDWLSEMVSLVLQPRVGAVGAKLWYPDRTLQHGGVLLGIGGVANHAHYKMPDCSFGYFGRAAVTQEFSAVTAACLLIKKSIYEEVGGLNERDLKIAFNDIDFCLRVKQAGYRNIWTPYAELYHHESASRGTENTPEKQARFLSEVHYMMQAWDGQLQNDPAYSPNLTLEIDADFSLAWPPRVELFSQSSVLEADPMPANRADKALNMVDRKEY